MINGELDGLYKSIEKLIEKLKKDSVYWNALTQVLRLEFVDGEQVDDLLPEDVVTNTEYIRSITQGIQNIENYPNDLSQEFKQILKELDPNTREYLQDQFVNLENEQESEEFMWATFIQSLLVEESVS